MKLSVPSLVDALHQEIRQEILSGALAGGQPLTEILIATRYSVARPTAKAALERLVHDGLLTRETNKTAHVPLLSTDDIRDLYYSRRVLERELVIELCKRKAVPDAARDALRQLEDLGRRGRREASEPAAVVAADVAFHQALVTAVGSPRLSRLYSVLMGEVQLCMAQEQAHHLLEPARIADEHEELLAAIAAGNARVAAKLIDEHIETGCQELLDYFGRDGDAPAGEPRQSRRRQPVTPTATGDWSDAAAAEATATGGPRS